MSRHTIFEQPAKRRKVVKTTEEETPQRRDDYLSQILPPNVCHIIGSFLHHVPQASYVGQRFLGLIGTQINFRYMPSYSRLTTNAQLAYDYAKLACAVTRRLLAKGRGNVRQDIIRSRGVSTARLHQARDGFRGPKFKFRTAQGTKKPLKKSDGRSLRALSFTEQSALRAIRSQAGNCQEHGDVAYTYLKTLPQVATVYSCTNNVKDHVFLLLEIQNPSGSYSYLICDPWIDFVGTFSLASRQVSHLVSPDIYKFAIDAAKYCRKNSLTGLAHPNGNMISQPDLLGGNIFTLPTISGVVGRLQSDYLDHSTSMRSIRSDSLRKAQLSGDKNPYYDLDHTFEVGEDAEIPVVDMTPKP